MNPLVSVIIPAYKAEKYIAKTIESVLSQTYPHFEVLVIDDGSPDKQNELISTYCEKDARVKLISQKNGGVSSARNHGYSLSKGEYLAFLDADDLWLPDNLSSKLAAFNTGNYGLLHSDTELIDESDNKLKKYKRGKEGYILNDLLAWNGDCIPAPSSILVKREVIDSVGGFHLELSNSADQEFFFRVASKYKIGRVPRVTWNYRIHSSQMHSNLRVMEKDLLLTYQLASENKLFESRKFEKACYANMYMILGKSWIGDGGNIVRGGLYIFKSFLLKLF